MCIAMELLTQTCFTSGTCSERCQKALSDFLEEKRSAMPRFYFIGDEDLLEILGQASSQDHSHVNNSLLDLFQYCHLGSENAETGYSSKAVLLS